MVDGFFYFRCMLLKVDNLSLSYDDWKVLKGLSFEMNEGEIMCVLGESGCGKTSLLKAIRGFMDREEGEIHFQGERVFNKSEKLVPGTKGVAIVHQDFQLEPGYTVYDNIRHHLIKYIKSYQESKTEEIIKLCGLESLRNKTSKELSGGQKQKVALAKAMIEEPPLLLLDEPFSNLDNISKSEFKGILKNIVKELGVGLLFVTHDSKDALTFSDQIIVIQNGVVLKKGTPEELTSNPPSLYAAKLLGLINLIPKEKLKLVYTNNLPDASNYWIPQSQISFEPGKDFKIINEEFLGEEFIYLVRKGELDLTIRSKFKINSSHLNVIIHNPIAIDKI